jgi:hypothetical protein
MADPKVLSAEQLAGVYEKLKRADENIFDLNVEITAFVKAGPDGRITKDKQKALEDWRDFHADRKVPLRFAVLAGEIVHHLRSSLDHVAWVLSDESYREGDDGTAIAFPVLSAAPANKDAQSSYDRKINGITCTAARRLIEDLQPYKGANPLDDPLAVVHDLDRIDKHRDLVLVVPTFDLYIGFPMKMFSTRMIGGGLETGQNAFAGETKHKAEVQLSSHVAFAEIGGRKNQPVIPALTELAHKIGDIVRRFAEL